MTAYLNRLQLDRICLHLDKLHKIWTFQPQPCADGLHVMRVTCHPTRLVKNAHRGALLTPCRLSPHAPGKKRTYTVDDLAVLTRVRDLSATGMPLAQIDQALAVTDMTPQSSALFTLADFAQSLQFARDQVSHLQTQLDQQTKRLDALTAWLALPFYKRWFAKPPRLDQ